MRFYGGSVGYTRRIQEVLEVTQVVNIIEQGVTFPARCVLSGGLEAVVKYQRNPAGTDVLINEWIGNSIADLIGLSKGGNTNGEKLRYSVLRYSPSIISGEAINLGVLFSEDAEGFHSFWFTGNFQRIIRFDDTLEKDVLKDFLTDIQLEVDDLDKGGCFDLDSFIKFYINDFHFEKPRTILYENLDEAVEGLKKTYFRFDYRKEERPSKADDQKLVANWIRASGRDVKKNAAIRGKYADQVRYDFATEDYLVKIFDFDGKDLTRCINSAKA